MATVKSVAISVGLSGEFGRGILRGVVDYVRQHEPWSLYTRADSVYPFPQPAEWTGDGMIASVGIRGEAEAIRATQEAGLHIVNVSANMPDPRYICSVSTDGMAIGRVAAEHLLERGFENFGFCVGHNQAEMGRLRGKGFADTLAKSGFSCNMFEPTQPLVENWSWQMEQPELAGWVGLLPKPAAVFASTDYVAINIAQACRFSGLGIPEDVALLGVDNDEPLCTTCMPPLSSVIQDCEQIGYEAARILDGLMSGEAAPKQPLLVAPVGVSTRQSTDILALSDRDVASAVAFIRQHVGEPFGVDAVVDAVVVSRRSLQKKFKQVMAKSILRVIHETRIDRAKLLLSTTRLPMNDLARACGFSNAHLLWECFRRQTDMSPAAYRKEHHGKSQGEGS